MKIALAFHILIALSSVAYTTYLWLRPSWAGLRVAYALVGSTVGSGTFLVLASRSHLFEACAMGLAYLAVVSVGIAAARRSLYFPSR